MTSHVILYGIQVIIAKDAAHTHTLGYIFCSSRDDLSKVSSSSRSLLSPLSLSGPLPACDRVGASYVKPVPRAHKSSSLITQLLSRSLTLPPALLLHVSSNPPSSIPPSISILFFSPFLPPHVPVNLDYLSHLPASTTQHPLSCFQC